MHVFYSFVFLATFPHVFGLPATSRKTSDVEVIVVGAGAAGLAAASRLLEKGFRVKILEAQNRAGGRVWSVAYGDGFVELGAQAVWGNDSTLFNFVKRENLILTPINRNVVNLVETGGQISNPADIGKINQINAALRGMLRSLGPEHNQTLSLGEYLDEEFADYLNTIDNPTLATAVYDNFVRALKTEEAVDSLYDLSIDTYTERRDGDTRVLLKVPYTEVLRRMSSNIPSSTIILNSAVSRIAFDPSPSSDDRPITVTTKAGIIYKAHHVIVTVSLGVLKRDAETLFSPELPARKKEAIAAAGFGTLGKVVLIYKQAFWAQLQPLIANMPMLWTLDLNVDKERRYVNRWWSRGVDGLKTFTYPSPSFALAEFVGGRHAEEMEGMSDAKVAANLTAIIAGFTGLRVPPPMAVFRGNWYTNPHFLGTHSHISEEFTEKGFEISDLAAPVWVYRSLVTGTEVSGLLFAGEATHDFYFAHVNGALETGYREADRIGGYYE